jgi:hypothetical protein
MELEAESIRLAHGAYRSRGLRQLVLSGRQLERLVSGGYRRQCIRYHYATDELPRYVAIEAKHLGGRYRLADGAGQANAMRQFGFPL